MPNRGQDQAHLIREQVLSRTLPLVRELINGPLLSDEAIIRRFAQIRVRLVADERNLASPNGQTALVTALNLMVRLGVTVVVDVPAVPLWVPQPPLTGTDLLTAVESFVGDLFPSSAIDLDDAQPTNITFIIGDSHWDGQAELVWRLWGTAWTAGIAPGDASVACWQGDFPIGALTAAALAAPEVFKYAVRSLGAPPVGGQRESLDPVNCATHCMGDDLPGSLLPQTVNLDLISAGAITNAALYTLFRIPGLGARVRVMDADYFEGSNQNRYLLALWRHMGARKVDVLAGQAPAGWEITPVAAAYTAGSALHPLAQNVIVGTDEIKPRWWAQSQRPGWLGVGSTSHFFAVVSEHTPGEPCAGCLHHTSDADVDGPIPTVGFVSFWSGLLVAVRLIRHLMGYPVKPHRQQTYLCPLRLDGTHARIDAAIARHPSCPVEGSSPQV